MARQKRRRRKMEYVNPGAAKDARRDISGKKAPRVSVEDDELQNQVVQLDFSISPGALVQYRDLVGSIISTSVFPDENNCLKPLEYKYGLAKVAFGVSDFRTVPVRALAGF